MSLASTSRVIVFSGECLYEICIVLLNRAKSKFIQTPKIVARRMGFWESGKKTFLVSFLVAVFLRRYLRRLGAPPTIKHVKSPQYHPLHPHWISNCRYVLPRLIIDWILIKAVTSMRTSSRSSTISSSRFPIARTLRNCTSWGHMGGTPEQIECQFFVEFSMRSVRGILKALCIIRQSSENSKR